MPYKVISKTIESVDSIIYYQIDCIQNHPDLCILQVRVAVQGEKAMLEIDVSGKISFLDYLRTNTLSRNDWIYLMLSVAEKISGSIDYFLDPVCFDLSLSSIFYPSVNKNLDFNDTYLVYFPVLSESIPEKGEEIRIDPYRLLCEEILQYISNLPSAGKDSLFSDDEQEIIGSMSCGNLADDMIYLKSLLRSRTESGKPRNHHIPDDIMSKISGQMPAIALIAEIVLICLSFYIHKQREYFTGRVIPIILISAILLICGLMDLFLLYNKKSPLYLIHIKKPRENIRNDNISDNIFTSKEEKTVLLGKSNEAKRIAMLCSGIPGTPEESMGLKAYILVDDFLVGRDGSKVDFKINNLSVGRVHARISRKQNSFFIEDLGSKNGTYLDQKKLKKNDEYNMPDNCRIRFAEQEFYFVAN